MVQRWIVSTALGAMLALGLFVPQAAGHGEHDGPTPVLIVNGQDGGPWVFEPMDLTIEAGTIVQWIDQTGVYHTITSTKSLDNKAPDNRFEGEVQQVGDSFSHNFTKAGTYHYYCKPHASFMYGTITVTGGEEEKDSPGPGMVLLGLGLIGAVLVLRRRT